MEKRLTEILSYMPENLKKLLIKSFSQIGESVQEIRLRCGMPLILETQKGSFAVLTDGSISPAVGGAYIVEYADIQRLFRGICENSVYAYSEDIRQGFITIKGGHRVGITGRAVLNQGRLENFREITSLNIRVANEVIGAANNIIDSIVREDGIINTLIVAPPMGGKTTVLRDLTRQISDSGVKTAILDERGELASIYHGVPQNNIGVQTDVIENVSKEEGLRILLRCMSPQLIITDEIASSEDTKALQTCFGTGVSVIATTHGKSIDEVLDREFLKPVIGRAGFRQIILLKKDGFGLNTGITGESVVINR